MGNREWLENLYYNQPWADLKRSVHVRIARLILAGPRPPSCRCGNTSVCLYSRSGKYLDDPEDYYYECRVCHKGPKPIKYPGRPKGSKNKKTLEKEKKMSHWEKMCADAEKELYGPKTPR